MTKETSIKKIQNKLSIGRTLLPDDIAPIIGTWKHKDAFPDEYKMLSDELQKRISPEALQEVIDIGNIAYGEKKPKAAKVYSVVKSVVENMNRLFSESVDLPPTNEKILCGLTSNVDNISFLRKHSAQSKIDHALKDALVEGKKLGKDPQQVTDEIEAIIYETDSKLLPNKVQTKAQVIGFILRMFQHGGGKRLIADLENQPGSGKELGEWIGNIFQFETIKVGGAAAQMADLLKGFGEKNVVVYTQFNSPRQSDSYKNDLNFLRVINDELVVKNIKEATVETDPTKTNYPVERMADISVYFNGKNINANGESDRFIFVSEYYNKKGNVVDFNPLLNFSPQVLEKIGKEFKYFFITSPRYLQDFPEEKYAALSKQMVDQFRILKSSGVKILYEFSGNTTNIRYFEEVLKGKISSISINDDKELKEVVTSIKEKFDSNIKIDYGDGPFAIYKNALALAKYLDVDRLHVHGHNSDITVRKNASEKDLEMEVRGLMYAKQRITEWIQGKESKIETPENERPSRLLKREGFIDLLQFAGDLAKEASFENPPGKYLLNKDLYGLKIEHVRNRAHAELIRGIIKKGYYRQKDGYSVVIIPVKWVYNEAKVTTSSGDLSIIATIHSGI